MESYQLCVCIESVNKFNWNRQFIEMKHFVALKTNSQIFWNQSYLNKNYELIGNIINWIHSGNRILIYFLNKYEKFFKILFKLKTIQLFNKQTNCEWISKNGFFLFFISTLALCPVELTLIPSNSPQENDNNYKKTRDKSKWLWN